MPLNLDIPTIAITGSCGKTSTREFLTSIIESRWNILKNNGNKNLPLQIKNLLENYDSEMDAIVLEMGMGKPGAGKRHCMNIIPNISIITNIGTAHYGNLGNSIKSTALNKSELIKGMKQDGILLINADDENSNLLETNHFKGTILKIGINNEANYHAINVEYVEGGMSFYLELNNVVEKFFIPAFGVHNVYNALFAVAVADQLGFGVLEIKQGLQDFIPPIKRLNLIEMEDGSTLIDDTANANPESMEAAFKVISKIGTNKNKVAIIGSMLELGEYTEEGHKKVGSLLAKYDIDLVYAYGEYTKTMVNEALLGGFSKDKIHHYNDRDELHQSIKYLDTSNTVMLVKGSSSMQMDQTLSYIKNRNLYSIEISQNLKMGTVCMNSKTQEHINEKKINLVFGQLNKMMIIRIKNDLPLGRIVLPSKFIDGITIPDVPFDFYMSNNNLHIGPVIGMFVYQRYLKDPSQQLLRLGNYNDIKGLIYLFRPDSLNQKELTVDGLYYNPSKKSFEKAKLPAPTVVFNRIPLKKSIYDFFKKNATLFNNNYGLISKWWFWTVLSKRTVLKKHLPETILLKNRSHILNFLKKHKVIYLKPAKLAGGKGIIQLSLIKNQIHFKTYSGNKFVLNNNEDVRKKLKQHMIKGKQYIMQRAIESYHKDGEKVDFRVYIQKDYSKKWKYSGMEAKVAENSSVISNSKNRYKVMKGEEALRHYYGMNQKMIQSKILQITDVCKKMLGVVEGQGYNLGDVAFDLIIDKEGHIWVLEMQIDYAAEIKALRGDDEQEVLPSILSTPFEYAKALSKF
ncbi:hypothetical protein GLW08_16215 [Pontibacillus yanchengensis]|uniref:Uncharacterized protein n=1 Tax=Pontibacillus yanchengensis TaxID=462910 RepID=A0ACC7VL62_9BACI|nr:hypothetical protein [Pontibacillus yanchengensis]